MIVTLTPNPSVDRTIEVDALHRGAVLRALATRVDPGARASTSPGPWPPTAARPRPCCRPAAGRGAAGRPAGPLDVPVVVVPVAGSVRANVSVVEPDGTVTKLNEPGPRLSEEEVEAVTAATVKAAADAEWLACTGSLPPGAPIDFYARVVERLGNASVKVAVDSSGARWSRPWRPGPT